MDSKSMMFAFGSLFTLAMFIAILWGVTELRARAQEDAPYPMVNNQLVFVDPQTHCQYFVHNGLTPRMNANGQQICE